MNISNQELIAKIQYLPEGMCVSAGKKLIIVVPKVDNSPKIADDNGNPILDWQGNAIEGQGFTFRNGVASGNGALQAVRTDGKEVIIINNPTQEQEKSIMDKLAFQGTEFYYSDGYPNAIAKIKLALEHAVSIGCTDIYNSNIDFVQSKMTTRDGASIDLSSIDGRASEPNQAVKSRFSTLGNGQQLTVLQTKRDETKEFAFIQLKENGFLSGGPTAQGEAFNAGTFAILDNSKPESPKAWLVEEQVFKDTYKVVPFFVSTAVNTRIADLRLKDVCPLNNNGLKNN